MKVQNAKKSVGFLEPNFKPWVYKLAKIISSPYLRFSLHLSGFDSQNMETLYEEMKSFENGETKLILAFRHVSLDDAPLLQYTLLNRLPQWARKNRKQKLKMPNAHFLYGRNVPNYSGKITEWLFPSLGHIPVLNAAVDRKSMENIRDAITSGSFPIALAPEGQVTYHMHKVENIERGTAVMAQWAHKELSQKGEAKDIRILPIAIGYQFLRGYEELFNDVLSRLREETGLDLIKEDDWYATWYSAGKQVLQHIEQMLQKYHEKAFTDYAPDEKEQIEQLCKKILTISEEMSGLSANNDSIINRVFKVRYSAMRKQYREDVDPEKLPPLEKIVADYHAAEAHMYLRYNEIVDILEYIDFDYIYPGCKENRLAEFALNILDIVNRAEGGSISTRYYPKGRSPIMYIGEPISTIDILNDEDIGRREKANQINDMLFRGMSETSEKLEKLLT